MEKCHTLCQGPWRRRPSSVKRHLSEIFLTFFSLVSLSAKAVLRESLNPDYIYSFLLITIQPVLCIADNLRFPWGYKKNRIFRLRLPMNLKLGFKTFGGTQRWISMSCHCWRPCFPLLLLNPAPISVRHQRPGPAVDPLSSSSIWKASKKWEKKRTACPSNTVLARTCLSLYARTPWRSAPESSCGL